MKRAAAGFLLLATACGSSPSPAPQTQPVAPPTDTRLTDLQTSLTELLERLDVMNARITKLENSLTSPQQQPATSAPATTARPATTPAKTAAPVRAAQIADIYRNALELFGKNRYADARKAFQQVFDADSSGELADNALFWIGETYFAANDFTNAMRYYKRVSDEFGDQNKAPDAMFKLAVTYEKTGDLALARTTLQQVISRYPYSSPAASAKAELNRIKY